MRLETFTPCEISFIYVQWRFSDVIGRTVDLAPQTKEGCS